MSPSRRPHSFRLPQATYLVLAVVVVVYSIVVVVLKFKKKTRTTTTITIERKAKATVNIFLSMIQMMFLLFIFHIVLILRGLEDTITTIVYFLVFCLFFLRTACLFLQNETKTKEVIRRRSILLDM